MQSLNYGYISTAIIYLVPNNNYLKNCVSNLLLLCLCYYFAKQAPTTGNITCLVCS